MVALKAEFVRGNARVAELLDATLQRRSSQLHNSRGPRLQNATDVGQSPQVLRTEHYNVCYRRAITLEVARRQWEYQSRLQAPGS